jgi:hypothetical protein
MFWILGEWESACLCHPVIVDKVASGAHLPNSSSPRVFTSFFSYGILSFNKRLPMMRPSVFINKKWLLVEKSVILSHSTSCTNRDNRNDAQSLKPNVPIFSTDEGISVQQSDAHLSHPSMSLK